MFVFIFLNKSRDKDTWAALPGAPGPMGGNREGNEQFPGPSRSLLPSPDPGHPQEQPGLGGLFPESPRSPLPSPDPGHPQEQPGLGGLFPGSPRSLLPSPGPGHPGNSLDWVGWGQGFWTLEAGGHLEATSPLRPHPVKAKGRKGKGQRRRAGEDRRQGDSSFVTSSRCLFCKYSPQTVWLTQDPVSSGRTTGDP